MDFLKEYLDLIKYNKKRFMWLCYNRKKTRIIINKLFKWRYLQRRDDRKKKTWKRMVPLS